MAVTPETYEAVMECYGGCVECMGRTDLQLHHKMPRSKWAAKKYPLFIDSPINLICLCGGLGEGCHEKFKSKYKIREREAGLIEMFLRELKDALG